MHFKASRLLLATHGLTWLFWISFAALQRSTGQFPHNLLFAAGGLGPLIATIIMVRSGGDRSYVREYLTRISSPRRVSVPWWCVVLFLPTVATIMGFLLGALITGTHIERTGLLNTDTVASIMVFYLLLMLLAPVREEVAWRGYGQDALQSRFRPAVGSLILGLLWWAWHLPLFFMADTYQSQLGLFTAQSLEFLVWCIAATFIMTWIYNGTRGSILAAIVFQFMMNLSNELLLTTLPAEIARSVIHVALAVFLFAILPHLRRGPHTAVECIWRPSSDT